MRAIEFKDNGNIWREQMIATKWQTAQELGYSPVTDDDGAAAGGVTLIQVRWKGGRYECRRIASNMGRMAIGPATEVSDEYGEFLAGLLDN